MGIDIRHIAGLARIDLSEEEMSKVLQDLRTILQSLSGLLEADVAGIPPTYGTGDADGVFLDEDRVCPGLRHEDLMAIAPEMDGAYVLAPREGAGRDPQDEEPLTGGR